jgi:hypothetical protein
MILKNALEISECIVYLRRTLYDYKKEKDFSDQDVIKLSQELDEKINLYQKMIEELRAVNKFKTTF